MAAPVRRMTSVFLHASWDEDEDAGGDGEPWDLDDGDAALEGFWSQGDFDDGGADDHDRFVASRRGR